MKKKILALGLSALALGGGAMLSQGEPIITEAKVPVLSVYGEANIEKEADYAKVFGTIHKISDSKEEVEEIVETFSSIKEELSSLGIQEENVKSLYFYDSLCNFEGNIVYRANLDFFVISENVSNLKDIVSTLLGEDNVKIKNITYELKDTSAYNEALSLAKDNAIEKANSLLKTDTIEVKHIEEECMYYCSSNYKNFIETEGDDYIETIIIKARVKVTMDYVEDEIVTEDNVDKETGEVIEEEALSQENVDKETGEILDESSQSETENKIETTEENLANGNLL